MAAVSEYQHRWLRLSATRQQALENMIFSRAFCCRKFGQHYSSWKRREESRSANSAELRAIRRHNWVNRPRMVQRWIGPTLQKSEASSALSDNQTERSIKRSIELVLRRKQANDVAIWCACGHSRIAQRTAPMQPTAVFRGIMAQTPQEV
jgi:hypothetical protein